MKATSKPLTFFAIGLAAMMSSGVFAQELAATGQLNPLPEGGIPGPGTVLWDNTNIMNTTSGIISTEAGTLPAGANQTNTADDFTVPAGVTWTINFVFSQGFSNLPSTADSFRVTFFQNAAGLPGTEISTQTVPFGGAVTMTDQELTLGTPVILAEGNYWVSVVAVYNNFVDLNTHRWDWRTGPTAVGTSTAALQDTAGFFGGLTWTPLSTLITTPPIPVSTLFALRGTETLVVQDADISVTKNAAAPTPLVVGSTVTYTLAASNAGPGDADMVVVTDTLPANLTYVSNTCAATAAGQVVTWNIGTLANAANATCDIVTTVNTFGPIDNTANITSTTNDPTPANNASTVSLGGVPFPADVAISMTSDAPGGSLGVGTQFNYTVSATNAGPGVANDLAFSLLLSNKVSFISSTCGAGALGGSVSWTVPTLALGANTTCVITVAVVASGDLLATASVSTSTDDPNLVNNSTQLVVGFVATEVPSLGQLGLLLLGLILAGAAVVVIRR